MGCMRKCNWELQAAAATGGYRYVGGSPRPEISASAGALAKATWHLQGPVSSELKSGEVPVRTRTYTGTEVDREIHPVHRYQELELEYAVHSS